MIEKCGIKQDASACSDNDNGIEGKGIVSTSESKEFGSAECAENAIRFSERACETDKVCKFKKLSSVLFLQLDCQKNLKRLISLLAQ